MDFFSDVLTNDHTQGDSDAPLELVEYADYQCPFCKEAYYIIKDIQKELGDSLRFVFRNFPLTEMHPNALKAALAAEAAGAQDKFWKMHDMLFENQENLEDNYLIEYADKLKLDLMQFEEDFGKEKYYKKVEEDYNSGLKRGVDGTPAFFINGQKFEGNWKSPEFPKYLLTFLNN